MVGYWNNKKRAFVTPTDFCSHSMLHQTLTPPSFRFPSFHPFSASVPFVPPLPAAGFPHAPPPPPPPPPPSPPTQPTSYLRSSKVEREARMEGMETAALPTQPAAAAGQQQMAFLLPDDVAWAMERGGFLGEEFSVDDLLDFDGLEPDKEAEEEAKAEAFEADNYNSSASSAVSLEAPPLSDINLPTHDPAEFEWMSSIIDDWLPEYLPSPGVPPYRPSTQSKTQAITHHHESQTEKRRTHLPPPPKTVCTLSTEALVPVKAKRSKRARTAGSAWPTFGAATLSDSSASSTTTTTTTISSSPSSSSCSSSSYSSYLVNNHVAFLFDGNPPPPKKHKPKKRGRKPKQQQQQPQHSAAAGGGAGGGFGERHCTHCGTQKTPQWRTGPRGPKTLCNACGVRFKSGRLVPEYRPAASPTFVSHVHSNSHRKVLEMRRKKEEQHLAAASPPVPSF